MAFKLKDYRVSVVARAVSLTVTIFVLVRLSHADLEAPTLLFVIWGAVVLQIYLLIRLLDNANREMIAFLNSIRYDDFSQTYKLSERGGSYGELNQAFNRVLQNFRKLRSEREAEYLYLKNIIQHVGIGILSFDKEGNVKDFNTAGKRLFKVSALSNVEELRPYSEELVEQFLGLRTGAKALVRIRKNGEIVQLAIYAIELYLKGKEYKLVTVQNIHSELEEKEMEAWQNLIRVLTHEIRNSVTPIASLAATSEDVVDYIREQRREGEPIDEEDLDDIHLAIQTIRRRSESMARYVEDFRYMTHMPEPSMAPVRVSELFEHLRVLMAHEMAEYGVGLEQSIDPPSLMVNVDRGLIEQVLLNLIKNAIQAFAEEEPETPKPCCIELIAKQDSRNRVLIVVKDNGPGIEAEALDRIFIPFFTTKKAGSGIGLSLSRNIMRQHGGTIQARSSPEEGTEFILRF